MTLYNCIRSLRNIKKKGLFIVLFATSLLSFAQPSTLSGTDVAENAQLYVIDTELGNPDVVSINPTTYIRLEVNGDLEPFVWYKYGVKLRVIPILENGNTGLSRITTLSVEYNPNGNAGNFIDLNVKKLQNIHGVYVQVLSIFTENIENGTSNTITPNNITLSVNFKADRYYTLSDEAITINEQELSDEGMPCSIKLSWNPVVGAREYELEWTWEDNYGDTTEALNPDVIPLTKRDFELNNTRVQVLEQTDALTGTNTVGYEIPLIYSRGYLVYRVRAVGRFLDDVSVPYYGTWSSGNGTEENVDDWNDRYHIIDTHENAKNWQFQASYAEDGKKKEVVSYFDGTLRNRQTVTKINSDDNAIVGEVIYDNQGRPAIEVLPVPTASNKIKYFDTFNRNESDQNYTHLDFDWDTINAATAECDVNVSGMSPTISGSSKYYSPNNAVENNFQDFVPDALNYPFSQIEYTPDNTGRIRRKGGVGLNHQLGSGNEMTYFYSQPTSSFELNRLFGYQVGNLTHYKKNAVIDPNGQASVSYIDPQGRTIATALAGGNPKDEQGNDILQGLEDEENNDLHDLISANYLEGNAPYATGRYELLEDGIRVDKQVTVLENNTDYAFEYTLTNQGNFTYLECPQTFPYEYDLRLTTLNDCEVIAEGVVQRIDEDYQLSNSSTYNIGEYGVVKDLIVSQEALEEHWNTFLATAQSDESGCILTLEDFILIMFDCSTLDCDVVAQGETAYIISKLEMTYDSSNYSVSGDTITVTTLDDALAAEIQAFINGLVESYDIVSEFCEEKTVCYINERALLADVSPHGQYGSIEYDFEDLNGDGILNGNEVTLPTISTPLSIFNDGSGGTPNELFHNNIPNSDTVDNDWRHPLAPNADLDDLYYDQNGDESEIEIEFLGFNDEGNQMWNPEILNVDEDDDGINDNVRYDTINQQYFIQPQFLANVSDFITAWNTNWANSLVQYHPEYCYLEYTRDMCTITTNPSDNTQNAYEFEEYLKTINSFEEAASEGLIGIGFKQILDKDPFFFNEYASETQDGLHDYAAMRYVIMEEALTANYEGLANDLAEGNNFGMLAYSYAVLEFGSLMNTQQIESLPNAASAINTLILNLIPEDQDFFWIQYINNYLGLRSRIYDTFISLHASNSGCYNECLNGEIVDQDIIDLADDYDINVASGDGSFTSPIANYLQVVYNTSNIETELQNALNPPNISLCTSGSEDLYDSKIKRFPLSSFLFDASLLNGEDSDTVFVEYEEDYLELTGRCKSQADLEIFLRGFFQERNNLNIPLTNNLEYDNVYFIIDLFEELGGVEGDTPSIQGIISGNQLTISINDISGASCVDPIVLELPVNSELNWIDYGNTWSFVNQIGITQLYFDESIEEEGRYHYEILGTVEQGANITEYVFKGNTCSQLNDCFFCVDENTTSDDTIDPHIECVTNPDMDCDQVDGNLCLAEPIITADNTIDCQCDAGDEDFSINNENTLISNKGNAFNTVWNESESAVTNLANTIISGGASIIPGTVYDMPTIWQESVLPSLFYKLYLNKIAKSNLSIASPLNSDAFLNANYTIVNNGSNNVIRLLFDTNTYFDISFSWRKDGVCMSEITPRTETCTSIDEDGTQSTHSCCPEGYSPVSGGCCEDYTPYQSGLLDLINNNVSAMSNLISLNGSQFNFNSIGGDADLTSSLVDIDDYRYQTSFRVHSRIANIVPLCLWESKNLESFRLKNLGTDVCERENHIVIITDESGSFKSQREEMKNALNSFMTSIENTTIHVSFITMGPDSYDDTNIYELNESIAFNGKNFTIEHTPLVFQNASTYNGIDDPITQWINNYGTRNPNDANILDANGDVITLDADDWNSALRYVEETIVADPNIIDPDAILIFGDKRPGSDPIKPLIRAERFRKDLLSKVYYYAFEGPNNAAFDGEDVHHVLRESETGLDMSVTDIYYSNDFGNLIIQLSNIGINLADANIICGEGILCHGCTVQPVRPVSCDVQWEEYNNFLEFEEVTYSNGSGETPETYTVFESSIIEGMQRPELFTEEFFCGMKYAYITQAYIEYLDQAELDIQSTDSPFYLTIGQFGNTALNYGFDEISTVIADYVIYVENLDLNDPDTVILSWNEFVQGPNYPEDTGGWIAQNMPCLPAPLLPEVNIPITVPPSACEQIIESISQAYAQDSYNQYLEQLRADFEEQYIAGAIENAEETFRVIYADKEYQYTLYYYDQAGNLIQTTPPEGTKRLGDDLELEDKDALNEQINQDRINGTTLTSLPQHNLETNYKYNTLNQLVWQNTPDGGETRFAYDALGRIIASQNAKQKANAKANVMSYTTYDDLGRITEAGEILLATALTPNGIYFINDEGQLIHRTQEASGIEDTPVNGFQHYIKKQEITRTRYDVMLAGKAQLFEDYSFDNSRNRVTAVLYLDEEHGFADVTALNYFNNAIFYDYDIHGNVKEMITEINDQLLKKINQHIKKVQYEYDLISGNVNQVVYQKNQKDQFIHRYTYDADNRIINVETSTDTVIWETDAKYQYYEHGPLAKVITGDKDVQSMDYIYTLQGWLKGVNDDTVVPSAFNTPNTEVARDAFGYTLSYFDNDYQARLAANPFQTSDTWHAATPSLMNGNIRGMTTALIDVDENPLQVAFNNYAYDQLNRITRMKNFEGNPTGGAPNNTTLIGTLYTYDRNGNLNTLYRSAKTNSGTVKPMDILSYSYYDIDGQPSNRLQRVSDAVPDDVFDKIDIDNHKTDYIYDEIGQLTRDYDEGIKKIDWRVDGKVDKILKADGNEISFTYDGLGNRQTKSIASTKTTTYYIRDAQGNVMSVYSLPLAAKDKQFILSEQHIYGSSRLGLQQPQINLLDKEDARTKAYNRIVGDKRYELSNHLGNVLTVINDKKLPILAGSSLNYFTPDVIAYNDYYPFGMLLPNRHGNSSDYRYGFQGQELDNEIKGEGNSLNYRFRMHDPRINRFFATDPMFKTFPWNSPYAFSENRLIDGIEFEGLEVIGINDIMRAKFVPAEQKPILLQLYDGAILASVSATEGIFWTAQNPTEALKGAGNFFLMVGANGTSGAVPNPAQAQMNMMYLDDNLGTSTQATAAAFETSMNEGYKKLVDGSAQDKSEIVSGILLAVISEKGMAYVAQVGKLTVLARLPRGGKLVQYVTGEHKYLYHADDTGRIFRAQTDDLKFKTHEGRLSHDPNTPGKLSDDHAGHLFGDLFGGDPTLKNLVSQASKVNQSVFRKVEKIWEKALQQGKKVEVDIKVNYDGNSTRPSSFDVTYKIDGKVNNQIIENKNP